MEHIQLEDNVSNSEPKAGLDPEIIDGIFKMDKKYLHCNKCGIIYDGATVLVNNGTEISEECLKKYRISSTICPDCLDVYYQQKPHLLKRKC